MLRCNIYQNLFQQTAYEWTEREVAMIVFAKLFIESVTTKVTTMAYIPHSNNYATEDWNLEEKSLIKWW